MYEGSASTRCTSVVGRAMENTSTWSPPTELAIEARSLSEAATRTLAAAGAAGSSAHSASRVSIRRITGSLLELMGLVGPHGIDDAHRHGVHRVGRDRGTRRRARQGVDDIEPERGGLLEQRQAGERPERLVRRRHARILEALVRGAEVVAGLEVVVGEQVAAGLVQLDEAVGGRRAVPAGVVATLVEQLA